jgi:hypothetical protein
MQGPVIAEMFNYDVFQIQPNIPFFGIIGVNGITHITTRHPNISHRRGVLHFESLMPADIRRIMIVRQLASKPNRPRLPDTHDIDVRRHDHIDLVVYSGVNKIPDPGRIVRAAAMMA